ncbi:diguanylate cyclase domain-containing protein [Cellvibrio mixtus]|uniref:diguanylate cyclase domain-containing protein n=1 Tax=Cellvibrio mixtus TaxID=39650 RepID=UPI000587DDF0|nr:diguanylate cyclase [Cellvibrio mixtus]
MNIKSLHIKVSLSVAAAALLVVLLSSQFFYQRDYEKSFAESERSVLQLLETVQTTASIAAYVGNRELAQQVVTGLTKNDIVVGAAITAGKEIIGHDGKTARETKQDLISIPLVAPFDEKEIVGELSVVPNAPLIALRARDSAMSTAVGLAAQSTLVALLVLILVYWLMTRPLSTLSGRLHRITPGDGSRLDVHSIHRGDEIGLLAGDINSLLYTVETMLEEERQLRHRVESLETRFRGIFEDSSAGIFLVRERGNLVTANPAFFRLTGMDENEQLQTGDDDIVSKVFLDHEQAKSLIKLALVTKRPHTADLRIRNDGDEHARWVHCIFSPADNEQNNPTVEGVMYDVTQRKHSEARIRELAETDSLTGLSNRQAADSALQALINQTPVGGKAFAVMLIDLDRFKYINDTYGHDAGDKVLVTVAERLRKLVRDSDVVARMGGDEFFIILNHAGNIGMVTRIAQKILDAQQAPIEVQAGVLEKIGISIGIALYPDHGDNPLSLRKHADQAMYAVKRRGKNNFAIYEPGEDPLMESA